MLFIKRERTTGDKAVNMKMISQFLRPGMKDTDKSKLTIHLPLWITGKGMQRLTHSNKKVIKHDLWVKQNDRFQLMGNGKDHMKIVTRQQICLPVIEPFFFDHGLCLSLQEL